MGAPPHVLWFTEIRRNYVAVAGGNVLNLGELAAAGIPGPPGFRRDDGGLHRLAREANLSNKLEGVTVAINGDRCSTRTEQSKGVARG